MKLRVRPAALVLALAMTATGSVLYVATASKPSTLTSFSIPKVTSEVPASVSAAKPPRPLLIPHTQNASSTATIPAPALEAYRYAATVINQVSSCGITWTLIAGIGRVESDHGRYGDSRLNTKGVSVPGIYGVALDGRSHTAKVADTDHGKIDGDPVFDRAVGPLQFIPSTWAVVGEDGDNDGKKDPQNIHDAALAAAVYLCAGSAELSNVAAERQAVLRYNHSEAYADEVLAFSRLYANSAVGAVDPVVVAQGPVFAEPGTEASPPDARHISAHVRPATPSPGSHRPTAPRPATPPTTAAAIPGVVRKTLTPVQVATTFCTDQLTKPQQTALGGLAACISAYVQGGAGAVAGLLSGLSDTLKVLLNL